MGKEQNPFIFSAKRVCCAKANKIRLSILQVLSPPSSWIWVFAVGHVGRLQSLPGEDLLLGERSLVTGQCQSGHRGVSPEIDGTKEDSGMCPSALNADQLQTCICLWFTWF
ncbi:hypothetical protein EYF80_043282 [Liparis tanakae]|uniref:Uncharacterized protein n=1 Tax=Liparis tanakae TaxID=230148 RepID=A0A4Z2FYX8_9TELE|nr:hypothetical protein EYF80_043282 [Liparis tanakae]